MSKKILEALTCLIDKIENYQATIQLKCKNSRQEFVISTKYLPSGVKKGEVLTLQFMTNAEAQKNKKDLAYSILEEILKGDHGSQRNRAAK